MIYLVEVVATEFYRITVEAESEEQAEEKASNMEFSEMVDMERATVEFTIIRTKEKENEMS